MTISEKMEFLKRYISETQYPHKVKLMLKDEGFFISSECARRLNISKQYFNQVPDKLTEECITFQRRKYYKLKKAIPKQKTENQIENESLLHEFCELNKKNWDSQLTNSNDLKKEEALKRLLLTGINEIETTTNANWDREGGTYKIEEINLSGNTIRFKEGGIVAIDGFLRNLQAGRYKVVG